MRRKCVNLLAFICIFNGKKDNSKNVGLYRNDELAVFKNVKGPASEKIKKNTIFV